MGKSVKKKKKRKMKFSKKIVLLVIVSNIVFTLLTFIAFVITQSEPVTLITAWFAWTMEELWELSKIKRKEEETK